MDTLLVTTAIPFVNGAPHLGHALEYVEADVLARHARAHGGSVLLLTGTDEHAAKNVQAAAAAHRPVDEFVTANASRFRRLADALNVSYDDFIRTSPTRATAPLSRSSGAGPSGAEISTAPATRAGTAPAVRNSATRRAPSTTPRSNRLWRRTGSSGCRVTCRRSARR